MPSISDRKAHRQTDRPTDGRTDLQTDGHTYRRTDTVNYRNCFAVLHYKSLTVHVWIRSWLRWWILSTTLLILSYALHFKEKDKVSELTLYQCSVSMYMRVFISYNNVIWSPQGVWKHFWSYRLLSTWTEKTQMSFVMYAVRTCNMCKFRSKDQAKIPSSYLALSERWL